jgi:hypothetical protein
MREFLASRKPSPTMAVAFIALLAALSGTAVALPGKNTVDSADIKNKTVRGKDLRGSAVTSAKVKNNNLTGTDIRDNSLTGADVDESTLGQVPSANNANSANSANSATDSGAVDGFSANELIRAATASDDSAAFAGTAPTFPGGGGTPVLTASINAPRSGFLHIVASSDNFGSDTDVVCGISVDGTARPESARSFDSSGEDNCATNATVPVSAGDHTVDLRAGYIATAGTAIFDETSLDVLFIPFGPTG